MKTREPKPTLWQQPSTVIAFARQLAKRHVMANLRRHGRRLRDYSPGDIRELACAWLRQHNNELMGEAQAICQELHLAELRKRELARQRRAIQKTQRQAQPIHQ